MTTSREVAPVADKFEGNLLYSGHLSRRRWTYYYKNSGKEIWKRKGKYRLSAWINKNKSGWK